MSAPAFSYSLRPGKFVDRALFIELLQYIDRFVPLRSAVYVGLGGPCMEDHRVIHGAFGLKRMISIERSADVFAQQKFNRPLREIVCVRRDVKDFVDEFSVEMRRAKVKPDARLIVWLDFEVPDELMSQLHTLQSLTNLLSEGDVIRVTLNAHAGSLGNHQENESDATLHARRMVKLEERFGDFLPSGLASESTQNAHYPNVVLEAVKLAIMRSTGMSGRTFLPLLIVQYSDGQPMLTVTGVILADENVEAFVRGSGLKSWAHYADGWSNVERVSKAPHLTLRERMHVDQAVLATSAKLPARLQYLTRLQKLTSTDLISLYRRYQRFFPQFQHVEM